jgi:endonuclease III
VTPKLKTKTSKILSLLDNYYGEVKCFLTHKNAFELICAVALSAQCTDERVNMTTPLLFRKYPSPAKLAAAKLEDVEAIVKPCGFYKNKSKNLIKLAERLVSHHNSEVPDSIEELVQLAGVGRKTANVVLGTWFKKPAGVVVDTHVKRIVGFLGLSKNSDPEKIEQDLNKIVPRKHWDAFSLWLISHGRETCIARRPQCDKCLLNNYCDFFLSNKKKLAKKISSKK